MTTADFLPMLPELFLLAGTCALLLADLFIPAHRRGLTHFLALAILLGTLVLGLRDASATPLSAFGGMFIRDMPGDILKAFSLVLTGAAMIYARPYLRDRGLFQGEFHLLCLFAVLGMMVLISAGNLITVYLGLELLALSSYALVALHRDNGQASEAAMKYFVLGTLASGMLLYGMSMVYGVTGSLDLATIHAASSELGDNRGLMLFGVAFMIVGIAFKLGAAPFHMWLPDVYHGAPTAITLFIGSAPKLAAFAMAWRLLDGGAGEFSQWWREAIVWLAVISLVVGNVIAIAQTNIKRMLAYSTISHIGFLFLGLSNPGAGGYAAALFYVISYALMAAGAFGAVILLSRKGYEAENIADFAGLARRHPWHGFMILLLMASLAGLPPLLGFWAKLAVLQAVIDGGMLWAAIVGIVFAVIGAYYYLRVIKVMFFDPVDESGKAGVVDDTQLHWLLSANALLMLVLGVFAGPLQGWCARAFGLA